MAPEPILNPDEIRDLLKQSGPVSAIGRLWEGDSTPYDFRSAALKKDEKIQAVNQLHSQAAKNIEKNIMKACGFEVTVDFSKHEMVSGPDAVAQVSLEKSLMVLWSNPSGGQEGCFLIDRSLFFQLYTRMLGGGRSYAKSGDLTPLDQTYLFRILKPMAESLGRVWSGYGSWSFIIQEKALDQDALDNVVWTFDCLKAVFTLKGADVAGEIVAVLPREMLNAVGNTGIEGEGEATPAAGRRDQHWTKAVWWAISDIPLPVIATLGTLMVPLAGVLHLKAGDEYPLIVPTDGYPVTVDDHSAFRVSIGTLGSNRAIKILHKMESF